jgi:glycosyl hydrolase family 26
MRRALPGLALSLSAALSYGAPELGLYRWEAPGGPANLESFSRWLGTPVTLAAAFEARSTWEEIGGADWQLAAWAQWVAAQPGRNLTLGVPMLPASGASLAACGAGHYDAHWAKLAGQLARHGLRSAYLRLGWEMDGGWFAWNAPPGSGKEASFAACFRRIAQVMRAAQPRNEWKFVLNPAAGWRNKAYLDAIWPGDAYVDVLAIDLYDQSWAWNSYPYPRSCDAACRLARQQNAWNGYSSQLHILRDYAVAHGKKVALPEWGVAIRPDGHGGGDNPFYIRKMHEFITDPANHVVFHAYWGVSAADIDSRLTDAVEGDSPGGATRFPQSAALFKQLFGRHPAAEANPEADPEATPWRAHGTSLSTRRR